MPSSTCEKECARYRGSRSKEAMRGGATLTVSGVSKKGTKTTDTFSLSGIAGALDRAHLDVRRGGYGYGYGHQ